MNRPSCTDLLVVLSSVFATGPVCGDQTENSVQSFEIVIPDCRGISLCTYWVDGMPAAQVGQLERFQKDPEENDTLSIEIRDGYAETRDFLEVEPDPEMLQKLHPGNWRIGVGFGAFRAPKMGIASTSMRGSGSGIELKLMRRLADWWSFVEFHRERESRIDQATNLILESRFDSIGLGLQIVRPIPGQISALPFHYGIGTSLIGVNQKGSVSSRKIGSDEFGNISVEVERKSNSTESFGIGGQFSAMMPATDGVWLCAKLDMQYLFGELSSGKPGDFGKSTIYLSMLYGF